MTTIRFSSLENRIVVFFVVMLAAVQITAFLVVSAASTSISTRELSSNIRIGERAFAQTLEQNVQQLVYTRAMLTSDGDFRTAIATQDPEIISLVLAKHGAHIDQNSVALANLDNRIIADTLQGKRIGKPFPFPELIPIAQNNDQASAVVVIDNLPYHLVVMPIPAQRPVAWIAKAFRLDDTLAQQMQALTTLQVSFLTEQEDRGWRVSASTLPQSESKELPIRIAELLRAQPADTVLTIGKQDYQTHSKILANPGAERVLIVWQQSLDIALGPVRELQQTLLDLAIASIFASLFGSIVLSQSIARPINTLAAAARRTREGDYSAKTEIHRQDEIGDLAASFDYMREAITAREQKILRMAYQDALTGLPNRALFNDRLDLAIKAAERDRTPATILMMDIDRFKYVNDRLGHPVGDRVLHAVGQRLQGLLRKSDTIARLGGDEFAIILPKSNIEHAREVAKKILASLNAPFTIDNQPLDVRISIGIASHPEHGADPHIIVRHADVAMYIAKRGNRGYSVFQPDDQQPQGDYLTLLGELHRAVELNELVLYFQPKVNLINGATTQAEALVRWNHPQRGMVPPGEFIPFAEQTGYIHTMTKWIIRRAIQQCSEWQSRGINITISVNICARDLLDPGLPALITDELTQHDIDPQWLSLEITENGVMEDPKKSLDTLRQLNKLGIKLSIDDYGTGYSSLSYVKQLPVTELKIDQSFVRDMTTDADDAMIVKSTIDLGHNMGLQIVAEGVEDLSVWALLRQMGCDSAQGYCISRPLPAEQFEKWLAENPVFGDPTIPPALLATH